MPKTNLAEIRTYIVRLINQKMIENAIQKIDDFKYLNFALSIDEFRQIWHKISLAACSSVNAINSLTKFSSVLAAISLK